MRRPPLARLLLAAAAASIASLAAAQTSSSVLRMVEEPTITAAASLSGEPDATLRLIEDPTGKARCLDGSPMAYYHRPGQGSGKQKWLLAYEGGGWCSTLDKCLERVNGPLGSSKEYKPSTPLLLGKLTADPARNPTFWDWNVVFVKYCDGGFFSGDVRDPVFYKNTTLYFRGKHIHRALVQSLAGLGLTEAATDIVVSGCSAGAVQTFINLDYIRSLLPKSAKVVGLPDSGFLIEYQGPGACPDYAKRMYRTLDLMNARGALPPGCLERFQGTGEEWRCLFFARYLVPYIQTPFFVLQSKYDYWQMDDNIFCETWQGHITNARAFGSAFESTFHAAFANSSSTG